MRSNESFPQFYRRFAPSKLRGNRLFRVISRLSRRLVRHSLGEGGSFPAKTDVSRAKEIIILAGLLLAVNVPAQTPYYYLNRSFSSVQFDLQGIPTEYLLSEETDKLTDIVQGTIQPNSNETYAIEKQVAIPICYGSALSAWNAAVAYNGSESNYPGKIFDNVGWVRGTKSVNGGWGAYLWVLQNQIAFQASTSAWWSTTNGIPVAITNVMVGSLGDYQATSNVVDIGPHIPTNYPLANHVGTYQVDITNVYYELIIPDIWITPREAVVAVGGSNVQFAVTGTNIPQGVTWTLYPTNFDGHAVLQTNVNWHLANVTPGNVATNYKVRATSKDNPNFYDEVKLTVLRIDIEQMETNVSRSIVSATLNLTSNSYWGGGGVVWTSSPAGLSNIVIGADYRTFTFNPSNSVPATYVVRAWSSLLTNCYDTCTVIVFKVEMITPDGDPINAPVDSGDGQNEYTFSTNNPSTLEMNLKAKVTPTGIASQIASRCQFSVDTVGNSTLAWDSVNPSGMPIVSNDFLLAKVTFTGLPANNAAFGSKKATVCFNTTKQDEKPYEIFFAKWGYNNPVGGTNNPNWFYYWKEGGVCGIGTNCVFVKRANTWGYTQPWDDSIIRLCDKAPEANNGPQTFYSYRANEGYGEPPNGSITVTGQGKGINCVAETIQHESEHIYIYGIFNGQTDGDWDGIPNTQETTNSATSYGSIASDYTNDDTYNMRYPGTYSDQELRGRKKEMIQTINVYTNLDWANPGFQSKNAYGP